MRIPDHIIDSVREYAHNEIVGIIGARVQLRHRGRSYTGLCPLHGEKTPSFTVDVNKGYFKCFGCGESGDALTFIMKMERLGFLEAVAYLAAKANITIPHEEEPDDPAHTKRKNAMQALQAAGEYYAAMLKEDAGQIYVHYLRRRGIDAELIERFGIGCTPDASETLHAHLTANGYTDEMLLDAGLIHEQSKSGNPDKFVYRLMFPLCDNMGRVLGFTGRVIDDTRYPKYMNSPATICYDKSKVLYGLHQAKATIRMEQCAYLVEGQMDVISMHDVGIHNTVASSGTAVTEQHLRQLRSLASKLTVFFDGDKAGHKAACKCIEIALKLGFSVYVISTSGGADPDTLSHKYGSQLAELLKAREVSWLQYMVHMLRSSSEETPEDLAGHARMLYQWITTIPDIATRSFYIRELGDKYNFTTDQLRSMYGETTADVQTTVDRKPIDLVEHAVLSYAMMPGGLVTLIEDYGVDRTFFVTPRAADLFQKMIVAHDSNHGGVSSLINDDSLDVDDRSLLLSLSSVKDVNPASAVRYMRLCRQRRLIDSTTRKITQSADPAARALLAKDLARYSSELVHIEMATGQ